MSMRGLLKLEIDLTNKRLVIAEAGVNHNGSQLHAQGLVDIAHEAGEDIVKFQMFSAEKFLT